MSLLLGRHLAMQSREPHRPRKIKGIRLPSAARLYYLRALNNVLLETESEIKRHVFPAIDAFVSHRQDSVVDWIERIMEQIRKTLVPQLSDARLTWIAQTVAEYTETRTERDFEVQMNAILTVGPMLVVKPTELQQLFVRENIKLIRTVPENLLHQTEETILRGIRQGQTSKEIQKSIYRRLDLSKQRARLIARDQTSKYSGDLTRHHQTSVGITHYKWQTSNDERVRSRHANLDGKIFSWSKPPVSDKSGGQNHPRQGINCRCDAIPINKV